MQEDREDTKKIKVSKESNEEDDTQNKTKDESEVYNSKCDIKIIDEQNDLQFCDINSEGEVSIAITPEKPAIDLKPNDDLIAQNQEPREMLKSTKQQNANDNMFENGKNDPLDEICCKFNKNDEVVINSDIDKNTISSEIKNDVSNIACNFRMRLNRPQIPEYEINKSSYNNIINTFIQKQRNNDKNKLENDPFYFECLKDEKDDIEALFEDKDIKIRFECHRLKEIDLRIMNEMKDTRKKIEKLVLVFRKVYKNIKTEKEAKFIVLLVNYVKKKKIILDVMEELRDKINLIIFRAEHGWNFGLKCLYVGRKGIK